MRLTTTADFPQTLPQLLHFERASFGDYPYTPAPERLTAWWQAGAFYLAGVQDDSGSLQDLFTVLITTDDQYQLFKSGQLTSSKAMAPHPFDGQPATLYIPTLIIHNRYWMPVMFKGLLRELNAQLQAKKTTVTQVFATAVDKKSIFLLHRFGFVETGAYKDNYKILLATRQSSAMLRNLVR